VIALRRAGYLADGFECSRPMVEAGNAALAVRGIDARLRWVPPSSVPDVERLYDASIVGWNGYTYISPRARRISFLRGLIKHLRPGAPILLSGALRNTKSRTQSGFRGLQTRCE
jgi:hypothetical protein